MADTPPPAGGAASGFFTRRVGPLPMWAWMGLAVGAGLGVIGWQNARGGKPAADDGQGVTQEYPTTLDPTWVFQHYDQDQTFTNVTVPNAPPGGGRTGPPIGTNPPVFKPRPVPVTPPAAPIGTNPPVFQPKPVPAAPPPPPAGTWITAVPWAKGQPKGTPSTLWGMAERAYGNGNLWSTIWSAPQNAAVRSKRGAPEKIQPGDRFWAPTK